MLSIFIDSGMRQILLAHCYNITKICSHQFTISCRFFSGNRLVFIGLADNSCQNGQHLQERDFLKKVFY